MFMEVEEEGKKVSGQIQVGTGMAEQMVECPT